MMLSQATRFSNCTSYRWKCSGWVSTPLWVIFQIWVPSSALAIGVTSHAVWLCGSLVPSISSVGGLM